VIRTGRTEDHICVWNGFIATISDKPETITVWDPSKLSVVSQKHKKMLGSHLGRMVAWNNNLVTTGSTIRFWKCISFPKRVYKSSSFYKLCGLDFSCVVWNGQLLVADSNSPVVSVWNKNLWCIQRHVLESQSSGIHSMLVAGDRLWTSNLEGNICIWRQNNKKKLELESTFKTHTNRADMYLWKGSRVVTYSALEETLKVWDLHGKFVFQLQCPTNPTSITEWLGGKLVVSARNQSITVWNWNGQLYQKICIDKNFLPPKQYSLWWDGTRYRDSWKDKFVHDNTLLVCQNQLWHCCEGFIRVFKDPKDWKAVRLLWLAVKKNQPAECQLARLPFELIRVIIDCL